MINDITAIVAEDLLRDKMESLGLCEVVDILTPDAKSMYQLELAIFEAAMDNERVKGLLISRALVVYSDEIEAIINDNKG